MLSLIMTKIFDLIFNCLHTTKANKLNLFSSRFFPFLKCFFIRQRIHLQNTPCNARKFFTQQLINQSLYTDVSLIMKQSYTFIEILRNKEPNVMIKNLRVLLQTLKVNISCLNIYEISTIAIAPRPEHTPYQSFGIIKLKPSKSVDLLGLFY